MLEKNKNMISCLLQGGLGNQLFQIATTLSFAWDYEVIPVFNLSSHYLPLQGNKANVYKDIFYRKLEHIKTDELQKFFIYREPKFEYTPIPQQIKDNNVVLHGFFQSEKYFKHNRKKLLEYFKPTDQIKSLLESDYKNILSDNTCSVHVRRGDYLKFPKEHPTLLSEYYYNSFNEFDGGTTFLMFSDDIKWCKENIKGYNIHYIEESIDYLNIYLMSLCSNNIIANSSFSWWGAWLNENPNKKVIAPTQWFGDNKKLNTKDLLPTEWETK